MACHCLLPSPHQQCNDIYWINRPTILKLWNMNLNDTDVKGILNSTVLNQ